MIKDYTKNIFELAANIELWSDAEIHPNNKCKRSTSIICIKQIVEIKNQQN